jgi:hypothetical protein
MMTFLCFVESQALQSLQTLLLSQLSQSIISLLLLGGTRARSSLYRSNGRIVGTIQRAFENSTMAATTGQTAVGVVGATAAITIGIPAAVLDRGGCWRWFHSSSVHVGHESRSFGVFIVTFHEQSTSFIIQTTFRKRNNQEASNHIQDVAQGGLYRPVLFEGIDTNGSGTHVHVGMVHFG